MKPEDVPDELVLRALSASAGKPPTTDIYDLIDYDLDDHEAMARALAAVLPAHEQMVRAKVAEEIMQAEAKMGDGSSWDNGMRYAARIARREA